MNKKGTFFVLALTALTLVLLIAAWIMLADKYKELEPVGIKQAALFSSYQKAESGLLYAEVALGQAAQQAALDLARSGGFSDQSDCGSYLGWAIWFTSKRDCVPNASTLAAGMAAEIEAEFAPLLANHPELVFPRENYRYSFLSADGRTIVVAAASAPLELTITPIVVRIPFAPQPLPATRRAVLERIREEFGERIREAAAKYGIEESLVAALIAQESAGNPNAISRTGCVGLAQFCYETAQEYRDIFLKITPCACSPVCTPYSAACTPENDDRFDPAKSIEGAARYLSALSRDFEARGYSAKNEFVLAAYNAGPAIVLKAIKATGVRDPDWVTVSAKLEPELLRGGIYDSFSAEQKLAKIAEIQNYVVAVSSGQAAYAEIVVAAAPAGGGHES